jgi:hypothetical protein
LTGSTLHQHFLHSICNAFLSDDVFFLYVMGVLLDLEVLNFEGLRSDFRLHEVPPLRYIRFNFISHFLFWKNFMFVAGFFHFEYC